MHVGTAHVLPATWSTWPEETFAGRLDREDLAALIRCGRIVYHQPGQPITFGGSVVLVRHGLTKLLLADSGGRDHLLAVGGPGQLVGETGPPEATGSAARVTALTDMTGVRIPVAALQAITRERPGLARERMRAVSAQLWDAHRFRLELCADGVPVRLVRVLRDVASAVTGGLENPQRFLVPLSQEELAQAIDASEVSVQRALRNLRRQRLVVTGYRRVEVPCSSCLDRYVTACRSTDTDGAEAVTGCGGVRHHRT